MLPAMTSAKAKRSLTLSAAGWSLQSLSLMFVLSLDIAYMTMRS
jgi:hypothetical protein